MQRNHGQNCRVKYALPEERMSVAAGIRGIGGVRPDVNTGPLLAHSVGNLLTATDVIQPLPSALRVAPPSVPAACTVVLPFGETLARRPRSNVPFLPGDCSDVRCPCVMCSTITFPLLVRCNSGFVPNSDPLHLPH